MAIGTTAALIMGGSALLSAYGAKKGADASKDAAATQSASGDRALALQKQMYEQQQTNLAPYRALGTGSLQNLGNFQSYGGTPGAFGAGVNEAYQRPLSPNFQMSQQGPALPPGAAVPRPGMMDRIRTLANPGGSGGAPGPQMVTMRAPTGEIDQIPADQVPRALGEGAVIVQGA